MILVTEENDERPITQINTDRFQYIMSP